MLLDKPTLYQTREEIREPSHESACPYTSDLDLGSDRQ